MKRKEKQKETNLCQGIVCERNTQCKRTTVDIYCHLHEYMSSFTNDQIQLIKDGKAFMCSSCCRWKFTRVGCNNCREKNAKESAIKKESKIMCLGIEKKSDEKCQFNIIEGTKYCKNHQYMNDYTDEQKNNLKKCSNCGHHKYIIGDYNTCEKCRLNGEKQRNKQKLKKDKMEKCKGTIEGNPCHKPAKENGYCGQHHLQYKKEQAKLKGLKLCSNSNRTCANILNIKDKYSQCEDCRRKDREKNKKLSTNDLIIQKTVIEENNIINNNVKNDTSINDSKNEKQNDVIQEEIVPKRVRKIKLREKSFQMGVITNKKRNTQSSRKQTNKNVLSDKESEIKQKVLTQKQVKSNNIAIILKQIDNGNHCIAYINNIRCNNQKTLHNYCNEHKMYNLMDYEIISGKKNYCLNHDKLHCYEQKNISLSKFCKICIDNKTNNHKESISIHNVRDKLMVNDKLMLQCQKCKHIVTINKFVNKKKHIGHFCDKCLNINRGIEDNRNPRVRDYSTYENKPEVREIRRERAVENPEQQKLYYNKSNNQPYNKYNEYIDNARAHNRSFELSLERFTEFVLDKCHYCEELPQLINNLYIRLNGIDRQNNNIGYVLDNCVTCCTICNDMKYVHTHNNFVLMIEHILTNLGCANGKYHHYLFKNYKGTPYNKKVKECKKDKRVFELSKQQFDIISTKPCYLCGKKNTIHHQNGIDRINNKYGYILNNCASCCFTCNKIKDVYTLEEILGKMIKITQKFNPKLQVNDINSIRFLV